MAKIFVLSAPSGAGKTTLKDRVMSYFPSFKYSVSCTTRPRRPGEVEGVHYFFVSKEEFFKMQEQGDFVETMEVHGNFYGTPKSYIQNQLNLGNFVILDIDVYGKKKFDEVFPQAIGILILPPNLSELEKRLKERGTETEESLNLRLKNASDEMNFAKTKGKYEYTVINSNLETATQELISILKREVSLSA